MAPEGRWEGWVVYVGATTLAVYTHYFAFLNLFGQGIFVLGAASRWWRSWAEFEASAAGATSRHGQPPTNFLLRQ